VRDVTRIAAGDPGLWQQIVTGNAPAVLGLLGELRGQLDLLIDALDRGARPELAALLDRGVAGTQAIPGKHGGPVRPTRSVFVSVPDHPGELARLFADAGASGVNIEDVHIDHDPGRPVGLVELLVEEERAEHLLGSLESRGWVTHR
jgi:prephenate dehydrogenase